MSHIPTGGKHFAAYILSEDRKPFRLKLGKITPNYEGSHQTPNGINSPNGTKTASIIPQPAPPLLQQHESEGVLDFPNTASREIRSHRRTPKKPPREKGERRLVRVAAAALTAATLVFGIAIWQREHKQPVASSISQGFVPEITLPFEPNPEALPPPSGPELTRTITVKPHDSEWAISEASLEAAINDQARVPVINAVTILNAKTNITNQLATDPESLAIGQNLVILSDGPLRLLNQAVINPASNPELAAQINELNSQSSSVGEVASNKQLLIGQIHASLTQTLAAETPIFSQTVRSLGIERSKKQFASQARQIPSREISMLRQGTENVVFKRSKPSLALTA